MYHEYVAPALNPAGDGRALVGRGAGAAGLIISRECDEMRVPNLRAVGRALQDVSTKKV